MQPAEAALEARSLTVRFGGVLALDAVTLSIPSRHVVGVIGPNGAGKTTFFNAVCGFVRADSGDVVSGGRSLAGVRPDQLHELGISRTLQGLGLWPGLTVLENVMAGARHQGRTGFAAAVLGLPSADRDEARIRASAMTVLADLGVERFAQAYPRALPYGVQKWVVMARALVSEPTLLLLDEPASGLNEGEIEGLVGKLREWSQRMTIALVEHRLDLVMGACDLVHVLDFGRLIASGSPAEVSANPAVTTAHLGEELTPANA